MNDFIKTLLRKNSLRKQCQGASVAELEKAVADLTDLIDERRVEEAARAEQEKAKVEAIEKIRETMRAAGVQLDDLVGNVEAPVRKKEVKAKYQITDAQGQTHTWTGRGRTPAIFAQYMSSRGISKEQLPSAN
jgi:DNA-binding protein H-NS